MLRRPDTSILPGSESRAKAHWGLSRNVGDPVVSTHPDWGVTGLLKPSSINRSGIAKRRKRSAARRAAGSLSILIVPVKRGNEDRPDPVEGREMSG